MGTPDLAPRISLHRPAHYEIVIQGHVHPAWTYDLNGMQVDQRVCEYGAVTHIAGEVRDQPALMGMLLRLMGNGYPLISIRHCPPAAAEQCGGPEIYCG
jgi:hypothetical protein